ncbi:hypothetical protein IAQ61_009944 [Plenodomus lingam]|uniref:Predicted protein n=1 Tax=Leptosphaeria maculans (strain JN3 / isolate v23.1.3 / race Av1-4-5-6-7-8) TaxID=985895 RepID=E4ZSG8_LEPMJ|nr:predicted protein [Plenodomus lingam JN3]KAH9862527.1 hypothetical protein IAQ61_009944 [Plenodomus lingam]CBX94348.1 predicted protein [Plenodomus lingam JN3]
MEPESNPEAARKPRPILNFPKDWLPDESDEVTDKIKMPPSPTHLHCRLVKRSRHTQKHLAQFVPKNAPSAANDGMETTVRRQLPERVSSAIEGLVHRVKDGWRNEDGNLAKAIDSHWAMPSGQLPPMFAGLFYDHTDDEDNDENDDDDKHQWLSHFRHEAKELHPAPYDTSGRLKTMPHPSKPVSSNYIQPPTSLETIPTEIADQPPTPAPTQTKLPATPTLNKTLDNPIYDVEVESLDRDITDWEQIPCEFEEDNEWDMVEDHDDVLYAQS